MYVHTLNVLLQIWSREKQKFFPLRFIYILAEIINYFTILSVKSAKYFGLKSIQAAKQQQQQILLTIDHMP